MNRRENGYINDPSAAERFRDTLANERAKQCMARVTCNAATELSSEMALRLAVTREGGEVRDDYAFAKCIVGNCGTFLTLEDGEARAYPVDCPNFPEGKALQP